MSEKEKTMDTMKTNDIKNTLNKKTESLHAKSNLLYKP